MDFILEMCHRHQHDCDYQVRFHDYVLEKDELSKGECPKGHLTFVVCPGCWTLTPTRRYIDDNYTCRECDARLTDHVKQRGIRLANLRKQEIANGGEVELEPLEREVAKLVALGLRNKAISEKLRLTQRSVETIRERIKEKAGIHSTVELVHFALAHGLIILTDFTPRYRYV